VAGFLGKRRTGTRTDPDAVELALDLTAEAIVLHERAAQGGWRKFAAAQLDDPEFPIVIGLLRNEAENPARGRQPVRLWLPGEQVLKRHARINAEEPAARLKAAFDYVDRETVYRSQDVAVAVAPQPRSGKTAILITFAETWREAREYAQRWGFVPGVVSTRHHAGDFGADGPVFRMKSEPVEAAASVPRMRISALALVAGAIAVGTAIWAYDIWTPQGELTDAPDAPSQLFGTTATVGSQAARPDLAAGTTPEPPPLPLPDESGDMVSSRVAPLTAPEPVTMLEPSQELRRPVSEPAIDIGRTPPNYLLNYPVLASFLPATEPPEIGSAPRGAEIPVPPGSLSDAPLSQAVPLPPQSHEPAPLERDPVVTWTGPTPLLAQPERIAPVAEDQIVQRTGMPAAILEFAALGDATPVRLQAPPDPPKALPPPARVVAQSASGAAGETGGETSATDPDPQEAAAAEPEAQNPPEETIASGFAPLASVLPPSRPVQVEAESPQAPAAEPEYVAMVMPRPRPQHIGRPEAAAAATKTETAPATEVAVAAPAQAGAGTEVAAAPEAAAVSEGAAGANAELDTDLVHDSGPVSMIEGETSAEPDPDAPTRYASLNAPLPPARRARESRCRPARPRGDPDG